MNSYEYEKLKEPIEKNNEWAIERRNEWLERERRGVKMESLPDGINVSEFINIKSSKISYIYMMTWALLSYFYLVHKTWEVSFFLITFPMVFFIAGLIPITAVLFIALGLLLSIITIKYINPIILKINNYSKIK